MRDPDGPIQNRNVSSVALVIEHAHAAVLAWMAEQDEDEVRDRLRQLSQEARLLACMDPLPRPGDLARRQAVAVAKSRSAGSPD